jgi:hypothetical protein
MDANQGEYIISDIFEGQIKAGWDFVELSKNDDPFKELIQLAKVPRNDLIWDPYAKEYDLSDGKYFIRPKWMELEDAEAKFPKFKSLLEMVVSDDEVESFRESPHHGTEDQPDRPGVRLWDKNISSTEWVDKSRKRVKPIECWYKVPIETHLVDNYLTGEVEELNPAKIQEVLSTPGATITKVFIKKVRLCIIAGPYLLADNWSPYRHNEYPFIPWWCFLKDKDRSPYGLIRQMRDPQDEINKRRSKAMHLLNSTQIIATSDAIDKKENDWKKVADQIGDPQGIILLNATAGANSKFEIRNPMAIVEQQYKFEEEAKGEIEEAGVNRELKGMETNASSGRAIIARQVQGNTMLGKPFQNYRRSRQLLGQRIWSMIQQFWTRPKVLRITNKTGEHDFIELNMPVNLNGKVYIKNDITQAKVDIVIDEQAFNATVRQTLADEMFLLISKLPPEIGILMLDDVIDFLDLPNKDKLMQKIQMVQGVMQQQMGTKQENERMVAEATKAKSETNTVNRSSEESAMRGGLPGSA